MARSPSFSCWLLVCWLATAVAEGKEAVTPPGGPENNMNPTDCQIFPLTPAPSTRAPVTGVWRTPQTPRCPIHNFPLRRPRVYLTLPNRPFFPPKCNHHFPFRPFYGSHGRLPLNYFPIRKLSSDSSSEESGEEREADTR